MMRLHQATASRPLVRELSAFFLIARRAGENDIADIVGATATKRYHMFNMVLCHLLRAVVTLAFLLLILCLYLFSGAASAYGKLTGASVLSFNTIKHPGFFWIGLSQVQHVRAVSGIVLFKMGIVVFLCILSVALSIITSVSVIFVALLTAEDQPVFCFSIAIEVCKRCREYFFAFCATFLSILNRRKRIFSNLMAQFTASFQSTSFCPVDAEVFRRCREWLLAFVASLLRNIKHRLNSFSLVPCVVACQVSRKHFSLWFMRPKLDTLCLLYHSL